MSANLTGRKRGEAYLDLEGQAEKRMVELQTPTRRREVDATLSNPAAEAAVIAGLVRCGDPAAIGRYALEHRLDSECFTIPAFRAAYAAITDLAAAGEPVDVPILAQRMAHEDLAAVDSACREHVSAANFGSYARILIECKQRRAEAAARDRLARAIESSVPPHELASLFEAVRAASAGDSGDKTAPPPWKSLDLNDMSKARITPKCIVENMLFADLALIAAEGGTGKTTLLLYESIHIALGRDLWGCRVLNPGRTLFITAEDGEEILQARLLKIMDAMGLNDWQRRKVAESIMFWDVTGSLVRLAELDGRGNLKLTELADRIVETYRDANLAQVVFDPCISFGPGERIVNDGEQAIVTACRRIIRGLNCCVRLVHHTGKSNARNGEIDQYAGRGGTALPDGARMVTILSGVNRTTSRPQNLHLQPGESGFVMARAKLSYAPPQPNIWVIRTGWTFSYIIERPCNPEAVRSQDAETVADFLINEFAHGRRYTANSLELCGSTGLSRARLRAALAVLETLGRIEERDLPDDQKHGRRKTYLHALKAATQSGGLAADYPPNRQPDNPIPPASSNPPHYREYINGGLDAVLYSPISTNPPADTGGLAADWRISDESATEPPQQPAPTQPITRAQAQEINRQHVKESLAEMVELPGGWLISEPPAPVDSTPTPPDNPDTPRDNQRQPTKPLSPLDGDITRYLANVAGTATEDEVHRQTSHGQQGRTLPLVRVALHKLVAAGVVDKVNGQYRLAGRVTP